MKFKTRPKFLEAHAWKSGMPLSEWGVDELGVEHTKRGCFIGVRRVEEGDYIFTSPDGELSAMSAKNFEALYARATKEDVERAAAEEAEREAATLAVVVVESAAPAEPEPSEEPKEETKEDEAKADEAMAELAAKE